MSAALQLTDVEQRATRFPSSFEIPEREDREALRLDDYAKLVFSDRERMWVRVVVVRFRPGAAPLYTGRLMNEPVALPSVRYGELVSFEPRHVCAIRWDRSGPRRPRWT